MRGSMRNSCFISKNKKRENAWNSSPAGMLWNLLPVKTKIGGMNHGRERHFGENSVVPCRCICGLRKCPYLWRKKRLLSCELQPAPTESFYHGIKRETGKERALAKDVGNNSADARNQFCDISFFRTEGGEIKAQYLIENETRLKKRQILRKASYQGGAYRG